MFMPYVRLLALVTAGSVAALLQAAQPLQPSRGVTADGRVITSPYGVPPPWGRDITRLVKAHYPDSLVPQHPIGTGFYRLILDLRSGHVRGVVVEQSSGYPDIDSSIVAALQQWQLKPNRWRQFQVHVTLAYKKPSGTSNHSLQPTASRRE
jgi:TonB family protein